MISVSWIVTPSEIAGCSGHISCRLPLFYVISKRERVEVANPQKELAPFTPVFY